MEISNLKQELEERVGRVEKARSRKYTIHKIFKKFIALFKFVFILSFLSCYIMVAFPFLFAVLWPVIVVAVVSGGAFLLLEAYDPANSYRKYFKEEIVGWLMHQINESYDYNPDDKIPEEEVTKSNVFKEKLDLYRGEDHVKGEIEGVAVEFCEGQFYVDKETVGSFFMSLLEDIMGFLLKLVLWPLLLLSGGNTEVLDEEEEEGSHNYIMFFGGLIMKADFNRRHNGNLHILPASKVRKGLLKTDFYHGKKFIEMDDPHFNETYAVYTSGELEAHYVLSTSLMEKLMSLNALAKSDVYFSLMEGKLYLAIDWGKDLFESHISKPITSAQDMAYIVDQINFFEYLVRHLSLERNIWK